MTNMEEDQVNEEARAIMEEHSQQTTPNSNGMCDSHQIHIRQQQQQQQQQKSSQQQQLQRQATNQSLPMPSSTCGGCRRPINEQFYMKVDKTAWHEGCVSCCICNQPLIKFCYVRNGKMYCQQDYQRLQICQRCSEPIRPNEYVFPGPIHIDCNSCAICNRPLKQGDQYYLTDHKALCPPCKSSRECNNRVDGSGEQQDSGSDTDKTDDEAFDSNLASQSGGGYQRQYAPFTPGGSVRPMALDARGSGGHASPSNPSKSRPIAGSSSSICTTGSGGTDGKRPAGKRPRTILTTAQRRKFKASFEVSQKPCRKVRETLALETGLSPRVVQVWFQNQRAKIKKIARRQTQEEGSTSGQNTSRNMKRRKKTNDSDSDNETSSPGSYISLPATPHHGGSHLHDTYRSPDSIQTSPPASSDGGTVFFSNMHSHQGIDYVYDDYSGQLQPPPPQQILSTTALPPPSTCTPGGNDVSTPSTASSTAQQPPPPPLNSQNVILYHHDVGHGGQSTSELPFPPSLPVHHRGGGDNNNGQLVPFDYGGGSGGPVVEVTSPPPPSHHHHHHHQYYPPPSSVTSSAADNQFAAPVPLGGGGAVVGGAPGDDTPIDKLLYMQNNYFPT